MMNNKGMTLTELLISVVMLSVAMVLMYSLLSDIQKRKKEVDLRSDDLVKVADIEKKLQTYIMEDTCDYGREPVSSVSVSVAEKQAVIVIDGERHTIEVNSNAITYSNSIYVEKKAKWTLKNKTCDSIVNEMANSNSKMSYIVITCKGNSNEDIKDSIRIPMYFKTLDSNIKQ